MEVRYSNGSITSFFAVAVAGAMWTCSPSYIILQRGTADNKGDIWLLDQYTADKFIKSGALHATFTWGYKLK